MSFTVKFWGVRGSLPSAPTPNELLEHIKKTLESFFAAGHTSREAISDFLSQQEVSALGGYGAATTCVEVYTPRTRLILDGGSGIRNLSESIMAGHFGVAKGAYHILMTHFHWDHIIGLPFFNPHFIPGAEIHYYAVQEDLEKCIRQVFTRPFFPVSFETLKAKIFFHRLEPRQSFKIQDFTITPYQLDHPDPCWGYRIESEGKVYAHCVDTESTRVSREELGLDLPLYQNADLMYYDAQYSLKELAEKANWGHSSAQVGLELALRENIKHVLFAHHDPGASIDHLLELKKQTQNFYNSVPQFDIKWDFAYEGLTVKL